MKYHYQFVSASKVRIELIPEDPKEVAYLQALPAGDTNNSGLCQLFAKALEGYSPGSSITGSTFMDFPKVALCSFAKVLAGTEKMA